MSLHVNVCVMCGGALAPAQLRSVDQFVRSAASAGAQPFTLESGGERKHVTVLFADIVSSTQLIEGLDPEDAYEILQPIIRIMMDAVHRYGGTVNQVLGDGIMALFGAPLAQEKHATMACLSALLMQTNAERINKSRQSERDQPVRMRVGLNSGEVVVRAIENDLEFDYRAIGRDVHFADKMQANAAPGEILASPETARLAGDLVMTEAVHGMLPKAFRVMDTRIEDDNEGSVSARTLSKMVGRKSESRALADAHDTAMRNEARIVGVTGAPGIGKSRLLYEFSKSLPAENCKVLWCTAALQDSSAPLRPVVRLLQRTFGIASDSDEHSARAAIEQRLAQIGVPADTALAALMELFNHAPSDPDWIALDPPDRRRHITDTILTVLIGECLVQPVVLIVEDLQFADAETCGIVEKLTENARSLPFLMLVSYRPEFQHDWEHQTHFVELRLEPLRYADALDLLEGHLGTHASLDSLKETLIERTDGIPFFLEECILHIIESGQLFGTPGEFALGGTLQDIAVPRSVHDVIASRIDHLPPLDKQVLVAAAVVGKDVSSGLLQDLVALPPEDYAACIERLHHADFLDEARLFPELELTFRHALIQEVAYGTLLRDRRRGLHRRIVEIMEARYADNTDNHAERLAHHAFEGQLWDKAVAYNRLAGHKALARSAAEDAVTFFERALEIVDRCDGPRIEVLLDLGNACFPLGKREKALGHIAEAKYLATHTDDTLSVGKADSAKALYHWMIGDLGRARDLAEEAYDTAQNVGDIDFQIHAAARLGAVTQDGGDYQEALKVFGDVVDRLPENTGEKRFGLAGHPAALCRSAMAWSYSELGQFERAQIVGQEGLRIAREWKHHFSQVYCAYHLGNVYAIKGDFDQAIPLFEHCLELSEQTAVPVLLPIVSASLGYSLAHAGRTREGLGLLQQAEDQAEDVNLVVRRSRLAAWKGEALLLSGQRAAALEEAQRAVDLASEYGEFGHEAWARWLLAEVLVDDRNSPKQEVEAQYGAAARLADSLHLVPLQAHCQFGLAKLARRQGFEDWAAKISQAAETYSNLGMETWVGAAQFELEPAASGDNIVRFPNKIAG